MPHTHYTTLISATNLAERLAEAPGSVFVIDCRFDLADPEAGEKAYLAGHLPGAHYLHLDRDLSGPKTGTNGRHPLPDRELLVGGLQAWEAAGQPLTQDVPPQNTGDFKAGAPLSVTVDAHMIERNLGSKERVVVDARSADRYRGENETLDRVGGHIPGALNRFFKDNLTPNGRFKPA